MFPTGSWLNSLMLQVRFVQIFKTACKGCGSEVESCSNSGLSMLEFKV